jgi:hypothetical protein
MKRGGRAAFLLHFCLAREADCFRLENAVISPAQEEARKSVPPAVFSPTTQFLEF